jgi:GrpB-like predicted nucleotidyltransferase (UPF0157 family)
VDEVPVFALARHPSLDERFDPAIRIVEPDPAWPAAAERELAAIRSALGPQALRLEHVGSTSVAGLAAKPIIDLQLSLAALLPRAPYATPLATLGYLFVPDPDSPDYLVFAKPAERPRTHHLHVCEFGSEQEFRHLALRDYLRGNPDEAAAYERLKRELAATNPQDRLAYIAGKDGYVKGLEAQALAWTGRSR